MLEEVRDFGMLPVRREARNPLEDFRLHLVLSMFFFGLLWSIPLVLQWRGWSWPEEPPFPRAWEVAHLGALVALGYLIYLVFDLYPNQDVRDYAIPLALVFASSAAFFLEWLGPTLPSGNIPPRAMDQWLHPAYFTADTLGIMAFALTAAPLRILQGRPAFRPLSVAERERTLHLVRVSLLNTRAILSKAAGLLGAIIIVGLVVLTIVGPMFLPYEITEVGERLLEPPSSAHPLGTDGLGQDLLAKIIHSLRYSLLIGLSSALIAVALGTFIGLYCGYYGGRRDEAIMRLNDVLLSVPFLILLIMLSAMLKGRMTPFIMVLILSVFGWSYTARVTRAQALSIRGRPFVERARAQGAGDLYIMRRHILPVLMPVAIANFVLSVSGFILAESTLAFLGMVPEHHSSLGAILEDAFVHGAWTEGLYLWILIPGLILVTATMGFGFLGYAMDDILNPRLKKR